MEAFERNDSTEGFPASDQAEREGRAAFDSVLAHIDENILVAAATVAPPEREAVEKRLSELRSMLEDMRALAPDVLPELQAASGEEVTSLLRESLKVRAL